MLDNVRCLEQILGAAPHKTVAVWAFSSYPTDHPRKVSQTY